MRRMILVLTCCALLALAPCSGAQSALPDVINEWSAIASQLAGTPPAMHPLRAPITLAILHLAMYDAVNTVIGTREAYDVSPTVLGPASAHAAAVEAGYRVLLNEFPLQATALDAKRHTLVAGVRDGIEKSNGTIVGRKVAMRLLELRARDGRDAIPPPFEAGSGRGAYELTPSLFQPVDSEFLAYVTPFTMKSTAQFRPAGPPRLGSKRYARDYNEVMAFGVKSGSARTDEQTTTAMFWQPLAGTVWPATIRRMATEQALDLPARAHFEAAAFAAFADGLIACWDAKFHFRFWRPVTAIRAGDTDRNNNTVADPSWEPLFETPNFPEYPSGHACATAAVAYTIEDYFDHNVAIPAHSVRTNTDRLYRRASDVVNEVIEARMLIGVHFRTADEDGADIGRKIARQIERRFFKPREASPQAQ
jgi:hypothetical protein